MNLALPFSVAGRIPRRDYWIGFAIILVVLAALVTFFAAYFSATGGDAIDRVFTYILFALFLWVHFAVTVKRLHDLNRPTWHYLFYGLLPVGLMMMVVYPTLSFIGFALWAWTKYHLGFTRGTEGLNDYGPDPLAPDEPDSFEPA